MIKPEWHSAIKQIEYKDWTYNLIETIGGAYLQITFITTERDGTYKDLWCERNIGHDAHVPDCYVEIPKWKRVTQFCRKWRLENEFTTSDIVKTAWIATLSAEEHEAREIFKYKGASVFGPHVDVDALVDLVKMKKNLDLRDEVMA